MSPPDVHGGHIAMPEEEFEARPGRDARKGAFEARNSVGSDGEDVAADVRNFCFILSLRRLANRTAWATRRKISHFSLMAGLALKFKLFGGGQ